MLYIAAYAFLLRFRNEALPLTISRGERCSRQLPSGWHSALEAGSDAVRLRLARRKNKRHGSLLIRSCWCKDSEITCPVHTLGAWARGRRDGEQPCVHLNAQAAMQTLRLRLAAMGAERPQEFVLHDFRRGHADDLREKGSTLNMILSAGEWKSAAFMSYINSADLERRVILEAHFVASDEED